jgi:hypothetical protein
LSASHCYLAYRNSQKFAVLFFTYFMVSSVQLHKTLGAALAAMGPDQFLTLLPLDMDNADLSASRIWLLPILKQHMVGARLGFFADHLLPLANRLRKRAGKVNFAT